MCDHYMTKTRTMQQTLFFKHKRPREEWDPTLWEIPHHRKHAQMLKGALGT